MWSDFLMNRFNMMRQATFVSKSSLTNVTIKTYFYPFMNYCYVLLQPFGSAKASITFQAYMRFWSLGIKMAPAITFKRSFLNTRVLKGMAKAQILATKFQRISLYLDIFQ